MHFRNRLKLVVRKVQDSDVVCDIGTDHAYVAIELIKSLKCKKVIASDIRKGPLNVAKKNCIKHGVTNKVEFRISNGLENISQDEIETVVMAGIGGILTTEMLKRSMIKVQKAKQLILQPMNSIELVREFLYKNGFDIYDEELALEKDKIYVVMSVKYTNKPILKDNVFYYIGEKLIKNKDPLLKLFLMKNISKIEKIIIGLDKSEFEHSKKGYYLDLKSKMEKIYYLL